MAYTVHDEFPYSAPFCRVSPRRMVATPGGFFKKQEMKDDEGKNACPAVSCAGSGVGCLGSRAGAAEIQPDRGSVVADREQHGRNSRPQVLRGQPIQGFHHRSHYRGPKGAAACGTYDLEQ